MVDQLKTVVLVGCGNMGRAMLKSWISSGSLNYDNTHIVEPVETLRNEAAHLGVHTYINADEVPSDIKPDLIIFAVKPQLMFDVAPAYQRFVGPQTAIASVAAGIRTHAFVRLFGKKIAISRIMPNTPAAVSKGMMVIFNNEYVTQAQAELISQLMAASGAVATIEDENQMDAVTALSGSGPAYVFLMIEAMHNAGLRVGLSEETAALLAQQTVYGAACYAKEATSTPDVLRQQVTSPGGTTAAALDVLMKEGAFESLINDAVIAAKKRSQELG